METPPLPNDNKINFNVSETFNMKVNEKNIKLKISYNEQLFRFEAEEDDAFPKNKFCLLKSLEELTKIDKYFRQFDNLKEVFEAFKLLISNKTLTAIVKDNAIKLKLINFYTNKEFFINLSLKEKDTKTEINSLISYVSALNNTITNLESQIKDIKIEFNNILGQMEQKYKNEFEHQNNKFTEMEQKYNNELNLQNNKLTQLEQKYKNELTQHKNELNQEIEYLKKIVKKKLFPNSNIVQKNEEDLIISWFDKNPISARLLLDVKIEDNFYYTFFKYCENKPNTIIFIKTTKNLRIGGFTNQIWPKSGSIKDDKSFVFSLTKKEKYKIINPDKAIGVRANDYISFGDGHDLWLYNILRSNGGFR